MFLANVNKDKVLMVGPMPTIGNYVGGIATMISNLSSSWNLPYELITYNSNTGARDYGSVNRFNLTNIKRFLKNAFNLVKLVRREKPAIVHFHTSRHMALLKDLLLVALIKLAGGSKVIGHIHHASYPTLLVGRFESGRTMQIRLLMTVFDRIVLMSESIKRQLSSRLPCLARKRFEAQTEVIHNFTLIPTSTSRSRPSNKVTLFFIGNLGEQKGIFDLIYCATQLKRKKLPTFELVLAGPFDSPAEAERANQLIKHLKLSDTVRITGPVSGAVKEALFHEADIFVLPSYAEGVPISILEAMAVSLPVVASTVGGIPEIVEDGQTGFLVGPGEIEKLAAAIGKLIRSPNLREEMGQLARSRIEQRHSPEKYLSDLQSVYQKLAPITYRTSKAQNEATEPTGSPAKSKRFLIVTSEFPPEPGPCGRMARDLAVHLVRRGHQVKVVCPYPSRPSGAVYANSWRPEVTTESAEGAEVLRVPSRVSPESRLGARMHESWSFGRWSSKIVTCNDFLPDAIYSVTWPMLAQAWIGATASRLRIPHVTHIMDLYPESVWPKVPKWVHFLTGPMLLGLDRWNALKASRVLVISESMKEAYLNIRKLPSTLLEIVQTWQDESAFTILPQRATASKTYGIQDDRFTFLFLGNIGPVAGVEHIIASFHRAGLDKSQLIIVGEGTEKNRCIELAQSCKGRIHFLSDPDVSHVPLLQSLADVCLLPVRRGAAAASIPSKLSSYMLSSKPVLASVDADSHTAKLIERADCGWVIEPENSEAMANKMRELANLNQDELSVRGSRGRNYAIEYLSKSRGVERLAGILIESAMSGRPFRGKNRAQSSNSLRSVPPVCAEHEPCAPSS